MANPMGYIGNSKSKSTEHLINGTPNKRLNHRGYSSAEDELPLSFSYIPIEADQIPVFGKHE
jgi:hypothetical protein